MGLQQFIREKKWKKMKKDQWLILLLAGILLLVIAVPTDCQGTGNREEDRSAVNQGAEDAQQSGADYEKRMEERLEQVFSQIEGVGKVKVMVTLKDNGEAVVEKDVASGGDTVNSTDKEGNVSEETKSERSEETVYSSKNEEGQPFVSRQMEPEIEGILVVAQGGGNTAVAENISEAAQALFSVEAHKIKVVKMNLQEGDN